MYKKIILFLLSFYTISVYSITQVVTTTADSGPGSLRQAIIDANADGTSPRIINFAIAAGVQIITPLTALPQLTASNILIDGSTQPGYAGVPLIVLDGTSAAMGFDGLTINAVNNCTIQDLVINNGFASGILITGIASNNSVLGCYIGVNQLGTAASPNSVGIQVIATAGQLNTNTIIGSATHGNILSGNAGFAPAGIGLFLSGNLQSPIVQGNKIGTDVTGTSALGNGQAGIAIASFPSSVLVCDGAFIQGNVISGSLSGTGSPGIAMVFQDVINTTIQGNKIGTDITGTVALPNDFGIITFSDITSDFSGTILGGQNPGEGNVISANSFGGAGFQQNSHNLIAQGNFIGTDITGTIALGNGGGLTVSGNNCLIGGTTAAERNIISNNSGDGLQLGFNASNNIVTGNYIGVDITGSVAMGNGNNGIQILGFDFGTSTAAPSNNNIIGGSSVGQRNIISNNTNTGIYLNMNCNDTIIRNNYIGVDVTGSVAMGNGNVGIQILGYDFTSKTAQPSDRTIIGGVLAGQGNIISSNTNQGIFLNNNVNDSVIQGNKIGVDVTGLLARPNTQQGIYIQGHDFNAPGTSAPSNNTIIGGSTALARNIISANLNIGIHGNMSVSNSIIQGNYIGVGADGATALGNANGGINFQGFDGGNVVSGPSNDTLIGGALAGQGNIISNNTGSGISLNNNVNDSVIQGNNIGVDITGLLARPNTQQGIYIQGFDFGLLVSTPSNNTIVGGSTALERNIVSANSNVGIQLNTDVNDTVIQGNYIGVGADGITALGNTNSGIFVQGANLAQSDGTIIGGSATGEGNIISSNTGDGIYLQSNIVNSIIQGNFIGTDAAATLNLGNGSNGILIQGSANAPSTNNLIGGLLSAELNNIQFNASYGVNIGGDVAFPDILNPILGNSIYRNVNDGINLHDQGNHEQEPPVINSADVCGGDNIVIITITAPVNPAASLFRLELFLNRTDRNPITEGELFIGAIDSVPSGTTTTPTAFFVPSGVTVADFISATATNLNNTGGTPGDTSEFTLNFPISAATPTMATLVGPVSPICSGTSTNLTLTIVGDGPYNLLWSDGFAQTGVTSPVVRSVSPSVTTNYSVIVTNVFGCTESSNTVAVNLSSLTTITLTSSSPTVFVGQTVTLTATPSGGASPFILTWSDGLIQPGVTGVVSRNVVVAEPTKFTVFATDANGCDSAFAQVEVFIGRESPIVRAIFEKYSLDNACSGN